MPLLFSLSRGLQSHLQGTCRFTLRKQSIRMLSKAGLRWSNVMEHVGNIQPKAEAEVADGAEVDALMGDWWEFTKSPTAPLLVKKLFGNLKALERELGQDFEFGGPRGSLRCWLPLGDCMCNEVTKGSVWKGVKFWLYMHPKDFLRKNNTGKVLWQVLGPSAARLCIFGIREQEDFMWDAFTRAGRDRMWCLFPEVDSIVQGLTILEGLLENGMLHDDDKEALHFVLIDGTWSNSKAMLNRLQEHAGGAWEGRSMPCVALNPDSLSVMHGLRPQPSMDRTCTASAASHLLRELHLRNELGGLSLDVAAEVIDGALEVLQEALAGRRRWVGRLVVRVGRHRI